MGYPKLAEKLRIGGVNIVEFMFHPDGSISGLKSQVHQDIPYLMITLWN